MHRIYNGLGDQKIVARSPNILQNISIGSGAQSASCSLGTTNSVIRKNRNRGLKLPTQGQLVLRLRMSAATAPIPCISRTTEEELQFTFTLALWYIPIYSLPLCYHLFPAAHPSFNSLRTCTEYNKGNPFIFMAHVRGLVPQQAYPWDYLSSLKKAVLNLYWVQCVCVCSWSVIHRR